jgi:prephenate dehydrogenase
MPELKDCHLHIIGLGLMGGSLAMALRGKVAQITAFDLNTENLDYAFANGIIDAIDQIHLADIVIVAVPANYISGLIQKLAISNSLKAGALVMDIGSTKTDICNALDQLPENVCAVGGHPMCGLAENGLRNALARLYNRARFVLCETIRTTPESRLLAEELARAAGACPIWMERERHDYLTAMTSHLPHLLNFALMRLAMQVYKEDEQLFELAAGGFDGATRLARTHESMITGMFSTNAHNIRLLLTRLIENLDNLDALFDDTTHLQAELHEIVEARRDYTKYYGERLIT